MQRLTPFEVGQYYHVYNRGIERREIYLEPLDYSRFMLLLYLCNTTENIQLNQLYRDIKRKKEKTKSPITKDDFIKLYELPKKDNLVSICAHSIMPNHFHLILQEVKEGNISTFMQKLLTAYSMHFNKKYKRSGSLFMKPFRSKYIKNEHYFMYLLGYLHLNQVKLIDPKWKENGIADLNKTKDFLLKYKYSSIYDYLAGFKNSRPEFAIIDTKSIPDYFANSRDFEDFLDYWLTYSNDYANEDFFDK
ncbi:MAG: transposase [Patescibacteria group bacterium]